MAYLSKKDQAKLKYLQSPEGAALRVSVGAHNIPLDQVSDMVLPDDFEFDGWKVIHGEFCRTVGECKAVQAKHADDWIYW